MAAATSTTFYGLVLLALVVVAPHVEAAITCGKVASFLAPCRTYVVRGGVVPPACCTGIRNLNNAARTTPDRQAACRCLKSIISGISGANPSLVAGLPSRCGVSIPYPISASTNCNNVK